VRWGEDVKLGREDGSSEVMKDDDGLDRRVAR
jgi:hypothetical protein